MPEHLPLRHAVALGLMHGPAEFLPVSSSGHTTLIPWLAGWPYGKLDGETRKSFEVALHTGTAVALLLSTRTDLVDTSRMLKGRRGRMLALSLAPPALMGYKLERPIERHLGSPGTIAAGLLAGAACMALADSRAAGGTRGLADAGALDGLLLGAAQASALLPGVSRSGATLSVARARGFSREDSRSLSWLLALPLILGASALQGSRLMARGVPPGVGRSLMAGAGSAFLSTLANARLTGGKRRAGPLMPYSIYRGVLAFVVIRRMRDNHRRHLSPICSQEPAPRSGIWSSGAPRCSRDQAHMKRT